MTPITSRAAAALACAALLASAAAGCGSSPATHRDQPGAFTGQSIRMWVMNNGPNPVADTRRIVAPFERRTGIKVDVELVGWDVQFDRIRNAAVATDGPDVTQAGTTQVPFFAALGGFEDLSADVAGVGGAAAYAPGVWKTTQVAGLHGTWAIPWFTEARAIYYRKDALRAAGVDPATAFRTWDTLTAALRRLSAVKTLAGTSIAPFGGPGPKAFDLVHNIAPFVWDAGGAELSADNRRSTIDSAASVRGVSLAAGLVRSGLWDRHTLTLDGQGVEDAFKKGHLAVYVGGPWVLAAAARTDDKVWTSAARANLGVARMPAGPSGKGYTFVGGSNLMVLKSSPHKEAAWQLIRYLSTDAVQRQYAGLMGMFPARLRPQAIAGATDAGHRAFYEAIKQGRTYAPIPQWGQIENVYKTRFGNILESAAGHGVAYDSGTVSRQLREAAKEADSLLAG